MATKPPPYDHDHENEVQIFAMTNHRNQQVKFGIKTDDRRRHVYIIGKSGMGKTNLMENMVISDIYAGHGCAYIDPHGDTADKFLDYIPSHRINDVVYFNPADTKFPIGFNILEAVDPDKKHLVANGLMAVFKKIWPDVWSARMEYILQNTILALLDVPGATLLGINRLYVDEDYRKRVISLIQDPVVKTFWVKEFAAFSEKYRTEAVAPVQNKVGQFLSSAIIRNIVAQAKSTIDMREIMDQRKILIVNLSKGLVGEENARLLGNIMITRLQLAAMERVDMPEQDRQDFYLYVDEFQNFATESFASILSEARKYRLALCVAHQYIEQLSEEVASAIFGNVGTIISFRVGGPDAEALEKEFTPTFLAPDIIGLTKYNIYLRLLIDGVASTPFSAVTLPPIAVRTGSEEKVTRISRERYAKPRADIESQVIKWSGFGTADTGGSIRTEEEQEQAASVDEEKIEERIKELQASSPYVGEMAQSVDGGFGAKKKKKPEFEVPCSVCGEKQQLTFEPDWTKPWFCKAHLEMRNTPAGRRLPTLAQLTGKADEKKVPGEQKTEDRIQKIEARQPAPKREERRTERPAPPSLRADAPAGKPRLVVTRDSDLNSDAEELRAAVGKPKGDSPVAPQNKPVPAPLVSPMPEAGIAAPAPSPTIEKPLPKPRMENRGQKTGDRRQKTEERKTEPHKPQQKHDDRKSERPLKSEERPLRRDEREDPKPPLGAGKPRIVVGLPKEEIAARQPASPVAGPVPPDKTPPVAPPLVPAPVPPPSNPPPASDSKDAAGGQAWKPGQVVKF